MSGTAMAVISGTIVLIALFLILTKQSGGGNSFVAVVNSVGQQYANIVKVLMGNA